MNSFYEFEEEGMCGKLTGHVTLVLGVVGFAVQCLAAGPPDKPGQITNPPTTMKGQAGTDLAPVMATMRAEKKLVQGRNKVFSAPASGKTPAHTLYAHVENGKVTKWEATDANGNSLKVEVHPAAAESDNGQGGVRCSVCVFVTGANTYIPIILCYDIDCNDAPKPKVKSQQ